MKLFKNKKGLSLIELSVAIALLGIIMAAMVSIFAVAVKNYRIYSQQSALQKEVNFTVDEIGKEIKQSMDMPASYDTYTRSDTTLILDLPAVDEDDNFLYDGGGVISDYYIYSYDSGALTKTVYADSSSKRYPSSGSSYEILSSISSFSFTYSEPDYNEATVNLTASKTVYGTNISISSVVTSKPRNKEQ
jgi:prepilin-type N-terminal cleavage/methylation domain-containing protein